MKNSQVQVKNYETIWLEDALREDDRKQWEMKMADEDLAYPEQISIEKLEAEEVRLSNIMYDKTCTLIKELEML